MNTTADSITSTDESALVEPPMSDAAANAEACAAAVLETFFDLVRIDSPSRSEAQVAAYCKRRLEELGFSTRVDDTREATGSDTGNLIAHLPGTVPGHIALSAHMDCVSPCCGVEPVIENDVVRSAGDTVLGADDKAGVAAIIEGLAAVVASGAPRPDITVVLTVCEELSLLGAGALDSDLFDGTVPCFVFDADGAPGSIVLGAPFHYTLRATFAGRAAHAGVEPEAGVSAIQMAAAAISAMRLGRLDECTTANIGMIRGGREVNIVADACSLDGECRSLFEDRVNAQRDHMTEALTAAAERFGGSVDIDWRVDYPGVLFDEQDPIVEKLFSAARAAGLEPKTTVSGGGADANLLGTKGAKAVTLGIGMTAFHSIDERIAVADIVGTKRFIEKIVAEFCG